MTYVSSRSSSYTLIRLTESLRPAYAFLTLQGLRYTHAWVAYSRTESGSSRGMKMVVISAAAIGLIISFYVYVFMQFGRELRSMRKAKGRLIPWTLSRRSQRQVACITSAGYTGDVHGDVDVTSFGENPSHSRVVPTYLKSGIATLPSQTGRLAPKRVAKG